MKDAAPRRDYVRYFDNYVVLRKCYIELANNLDRSKSAAEDAASLDTLLEWEQVIKAARIAWKEAGTVLPEMPTDMPQEFQDLLKESRENWKRRNAEWAPMESELDEAMKRVRELRSQRVTNKNGI